MPTLRLEDGTSVDIDPSLFIVTKGQNTVEFRREEGTLRVSDVTAVSVQKRYDVRLEGGETVQVLVGGGT